jgi:RHS repeat-associated protein
VSNGPGYTGHVQDAATGLVYMQQRYYDAQIGRFLSVDPVAATVDDFNRYAYVSNDPLNKTDPSGTCEAPTGTRICSSFTFEKATDVRRAFGYDPAGGHHPIPAGSLVGREVSEDFGREAARIKITDIGTHSNHPKYNAAVSEELGTWSKANKIDLAKASAADAKAFARHLAHTDNPTIRDFNSNLLKTAIARGFSPRSPIGSARSAGPRGPVSNPNRGGRFGAAAGLAIIFDQAWKRARETEAAWDSCLENGC